jgi:hypothetical protein
MQGPVRATRRFAALGKSVPEERARVNSPPGNGGQGATAVLAFTAANP